MKHKNTIKLISLIEKCIADIWVATKEEGKEKNVFCVKCIYRINFMGRGNLMWEKKITLV